MTRLSLTAIGTMFTLALCFASPVMYAERRGDDQQGQQVQQGQGQAQGKVSRVRVSRGAAKPRTKAFRFGSLSLHSYWVTSRQAPAARHAGGIEGPGGPEGLSAVQALHPARHGLQDRTGWPERADDGHGRLPEVRALYAGAHTLPPIERR
jgi:hypothetical protein